MSETRYSPREFSGETYEPEHDHKRLTNIMAAVEEVMLDCQWRTLAEIKLEVWRRHNIVCGEASVSARLRDLRNKKGWTIELRPRGERKRGLFEYRMQPHTSKVAA